MGSDSCSALPVFKQTLFLVLINSIIFFFIYFFIFFFLLVFLCKVKPAFFFFFFQHTHTKKKTHRFTFLALFFLFLLFFFFFNINCKRCFVVFPPLRNAVRPSSAAAPCAAPSASVDRLSPSPFPVVTLICHAVPCDGSRPRPRLLLLQTAASAGDVRQGERPVRISPRPLQ